MKKKELLVAAIENGTVIDHIPADKLFQVVSLLHLENVTSAVTIGYNLESKDMGRKSIIKIADKYFSDEELNRLYGSCRMVAVPLRYGAGIKGKVIEALYWSMPVLSTSVGAEGIPDAEQIMLVKDTADPLTVEPEELDFVIAGAGVLNPVERESLD